MSIRLRRQLNDSEGNPISGATVEIFEVGQAAIVRTVTTDAQGVFDEALPDTQSGRTNVSYDAKVSYAGTAWWLRATDKGQLDTLVVQTHLRLPRYTTTARDALTLAEGDAGTQIYNTTTDVVEIWDGSDWQAPLTEVGLTQAQVDARITNQLPTASSTQAEAESDTDRLAWTVTRLRQMVAAGPTLAVNEGGTGATGASGARNNLGLGSVAVLDITEVDDEAAYDALSNPSDDTIYWWEA